jgi:hypothetical protein
MNPIEQYGFHIIRDAVGKETCELLSRTIKQGESIWRYNNSQQYKGDELVEKSFSLYGVNCLESLSEMLLPQIESVTGKTLVPTYTYCRIYYTGAEMAKHLDRPSCEYSATLTLSVTNKPWEICLEDLMGNTRALSLDVGSMCVYTGMKVPHWRLPYKGEEQIQAFIHYVDVNGPCADFKYDGRPMMGMHPSTKRKNILVR